MWGKFKRAAQDREKESVESGREEKVEGRGGAAGARIRRLLEMRKKVEETKVEDVEKVMPNVIMLPQSKTMAGQKSKYRLCPEPKRAA